MIEWWRALRSGTIRSHGSGRSPVVALTFDDGPDPVHTLRVLEILRHHRVRATFFLVGSQVDAHPEVALAIRTAGHTVANHTYSHVSLNRKRPAEIAQEISRGAEAIEHATGCRPALFRPPRGYWNPAVCGIARRRGDHIVLWTLALDNRSARTPRAMADRALRLVRPGDILLLHDGPQRSRRATVQALPRLLEGLKTRGYRFATVPDLLGIASEKPKYTSQQ